MGRPLRHFIPGRRYLISQDGNKLFPIYIDRADNERAVELLLRYARRYRVRIVEYHYQTDRAWWIMRPSTPDGISNLMRDMQSMYSRYLNSKYRHRPACHCTAPSDRILTSCNITPRFRSKELGAPPRRPVEFPRLILRPWTRQKTRPAQYWPLPIGRSESVPQPRSDSP